jgi:hypothetical protein
VATRGDTWSDQAVEAGLRGEGEEEESLAGQMIRIEVRHLLIILGARKV